MWDKTNCNLMPVNFHKSHCDTVSHGFVVRHFWRVRHLVIFNLRERHWCRLVMKLMYRIWLGSIARFNVRFRLHLWKNKEVITSWQRQTSLKSIFIEQLHHQPFKRLILTYYKVKKVRFRPLILITQL